MPDRYILRENSGIRIKPGASQTGGAKEIIEVMVLDRAYCHRVVWTSESLRPTAGAAERRAAGRYALAALNAEDRADA